MPKPLAKNATFGGVSRLYLEEDRLVHTQLVFVSERIRRFYYSDIQAITCHRTPNGMYANLVTLLLATLTTMATVYFLGFYEGDEFTAVGVGVVMLMFATAAWVWLLYNLYKGGTCETWLYTPVSRMRLRALDRYKQANRVLDTLMPRIAQAQAALPMSPEPQTAPSMPLAPYYREDRRDNPGSYGPIGSVQPFVAFYCLVLLYALVLGINVLGESSAKFLVDEALFLVIIVTASIVFFLYKGRMHMPALRLYTILLFFVLMIDRNVVHFWFQLGSFSYGIAPDQEDLTRYSGFGMLYMSLYLVLASIGLLLCNRHPQWAARYLEAREQTRNAAAPTEETFEQAVEVEAEAVDEPRPETTREPSHD